MDARGRNRPPELAVSSDPGTKDTGRTRGFAFVMALLATVLAAGIATTLAVVSGTESAISGNYRESKRTEFLAEAGIQHALWQLGLNPANTASLPAKGLDGDKYDVVISPQGNSIYEIRSWGRTVNACGTGLAVDVSVFPQSLNYAVAAKTYQDDNGFVQLDGTVIQNQLYDFTVDWTSLAGMADWYYAWNLSAWDFSYDGILYVNGDVTLDGYTRVHGAIIAKGKIDISPGTGKSAVFQGLPGMPVLVASGNIDIGESGATANIVINGFVYSGTTIKVRKYNRFWGSGVFVCENTFQIEREIAQMKIRWDPNLRLLPPAGIAQNYTASRSWAVLPGTWRILDDLDDFSGGGS
jgi:hypothetical protein